MRSNHVRRCTRAIAAGLIAVGAATVVAGGDVQAASIIVDSTADGSLAALNGNGTCDLREALASANFDYAQGECSAGSGTDVITFDLAGCPCTITLDATEGELVVGAPLTITGLGASQLAFDGGNATRVLRIANQTTLTLTGVTIRNGYLPDGVGGGGGGGIKAIGSLTADNIVVKDNLVWDDTCTGCSGGGIDIAGGTLTLTNSTVSGNVAGGDSMGGGIYVSALTTANLSNVTISGNRTGLAGEGGGMFVLGTATLNNVTMTNNLSTTGGGVRAIGSGTVNVRNTIIAGNLLDGTNPTGPDCSLFQQAVINSFDYNLFGDLSGCTVSGTTTHNLTGAPKLGPLQDNGGETHTHALADDSPAVDAGDPGSSCAAADQRGVARPIDGDAVPGAVCDIGAFEKDALQTQPTDPPATPEPTDPPATPSSTEAPSTPPAESSTSVGGEPSLPTTGSDGASTALALAVSLALAGMAAAVLARRPRRA